jgi:hypothetical protein
MFTTGNMIRIAQSIFGEVTDLTSLYGDLGYAGIFKHAIFEVVQAFTDPHRGEMLKVRLTNKDHLGSFFAGVKEVRLQGELLLLTKDCERASTKLTLDFVIDKPDNGKLIAELFAQRGVLKSQGKSAGHFEMKENWRQIKIARGEIKGTLEVDGETSVYLPKQNITLKVPFKLLPKDDKPESLKSFEYMLIGRLSTMRKQRQIIAKQTKDMFGEDVTMVGGVYITPNTYGLAFERMMKNAFDLPKKPLNPKATYVGIEIELVYRGDLEMLKQLMAAERLHKNVTITRDESVQPCHNNRGYKGIELQVLCQTTEVANVLAKIQRVINNPLIDGYANRSCGLHVHVDMRNRDLNLVYKNLVRVQNLLRGSQPHGRVNNIHCKVNTSDKFDFKVVNSREDRYWVINGHAFKEHSTLEIRTHEGTVNCQEIVNWVQFIDAIASYTEEIPANKFRLVSELVTATKISIPSIAASYVDSRIERFQSIA